MKFFDFGAFQKIIKMLSREKILFHMLFRASHGTLRIRVWVIQYDTWSEVQQSIKLWSETITIEILELDHIIGIIFHHFKIYTILAGYFFPYLICLDFCPELSLNI